jgi:DNA-binding transcriptional LysR family regulator
MENAPTLENFRLKVFRAVARHRNFRMAAEELLLTQPAVTQQIKALEAELDTALFDRSGGRVGLTAAGDALLPFAERLAVLANEARQAVAATATLHAGRLVVAASQTIGQYLLPRLIAAFLGENPQVQIEVLSGNTQQALEALLDGTGGTRSGGNRPDLALIEGPALRQDVRVEAFMEDHMVCVVPAGHEWAGKDIELAELKRATLVTRELGSGSRRIVEHAIEAAGLAVRDLHIRMTFDSTEGLLSAVEAGLGIAFVSRWAVRSQLALGTLGLARIRGLRLSRMFSLVTPMGPEPSGTAGAFRRLVLEQAEGLAPRATGRATAGKRAKR